MATSTALHLTGDERADEFLSGDPLGLLIGMLLDQQITMEKAFSSPAVLAERMHTDRLDAAAISDYDPTSFVLLFSTPPALHRFPKSMAARVQQMCAALVEEYDGDVTSVWSQARSGADLLARLRALPGFGDQKAKIFVALLGKQRGVQPSGWRAAAGPYGEKASYRSVADIVDPASLQKVRAFKQMVKAQAKAAATTD